MLIRQYPTATAPRDRVSRIWATGRGLLIAGAARACRTIGSTLEQERAKSVTRNRKRETSMAAITDHDAYIAAAPEPFQPSLQRLRTILSRVLPDADEIVAYNMPGFDIGGTVVASYAAFSKQCGLYLLPGAISDLAEDIAAAGLKATKTGITFSPRKPIPDDLVERLVRASREDAGV
ncbi:iron chaperone [Brachybacterium sacelli]